jgi:hypothetical protein
MPALYLHSIEKKIVSQVKITRKMNYPAAETAGYLNKNK